MKKTLISILLLLFSFEAFSQSNNQLFEMINTSLMKYIQNQKESVNKGIILSCNPSESYLLIDNYPLNFEFSQEIKDRNFKIISFNNYHKKLLKKPQHIVVFMGPIIENDMIKITFADWSVSCKRNILNVVVGAGWITSSWKYSSDSKQWELIAIDVGGI